MSRFLNGRGYENCGGERLQDMNQWCFFSYQLAVPESTSDLMMEKR